MTEASVLDIVERGLVTDRVVIDVGYDITSPAEDDGSGTPPPAARDRYGRRVPKPAHGTVALTGYTSSTRQITEAVVSLFERIVDPDKKVRRLNVTLCDLCPEGEAKNDDTGDGEQLDIFTDHEALSRKQAQDAEVLGRERRLQQTVIEIKKKLGKNAIIKGLDLEDGATAIERNAQIGGHKA